MKFFFLYFFKKNLIELVKFIFTKPLWPNKKEKQINCLKKKRNLDLQISNNDE